MINPKREWIEFKSEEEKVEKKPEVKKEKAVQK